MISRALRESPAWQPRKARTSRMGGDHSSGAYRRDLLSGADSGRHTQGTSELEGKHQSSATC